MVSALQHKVQDILKLTEDMRLILMLHISTQQCNIETCLDRHPIFHSVLRRTTEAPPEPVEPAAEAAVGHTASINVFNVVYEVYRTHNPEAEAVTTSYKYTQVWHVHVEIQELVKSCWWSLCMPLFDGQGPGEKFGQHFWQVNVRAFALSDPTVLCRVNCWRQLMPRTGTRHA